MAVDVLKVLVLHGDAGLRDTLAGAGWQVSAGSGLAAAAEQDAVLVVTRTADALSALRSSADLTQASFDTAVVVLRTPQDDAADQALLQMGVEALIDLDEVHTVPASLSRALRHAEQRKRIERAARTAYATDLATGLPHQAQLLEHMTQLLALREREPAPMVLLVLRVEGYARAAERLGAEAANILRRKVAVRLRGGLRASDVVAAIGPDAFGVLLGHVEAKADGERVATKLAQALQQQPIAVSGQPFTVGAAVGLALYPEHGKDAHSLLQRASAQAGSVATQGSHGFAHVVSRATGAAANDDEAPPTS